MKTTSDCYVEASSAPIYILGDSHTLMFKNKSVYDPFSQQTYRLSAHYIPGLNAENFFSAKTQRMHTGFFNTLAVNNLAGDGGLPLWKRIDRDALLMSASTQEAQIPPALLVVCGEITLRSGLMKRFGTQYQFVEGQIIDQHTKSTIDATLLDACFEDEFANLLQGLQRLKNRGFNNLSLLSLPLPTPFPSTKDEKERPQPMRLALTIRANQYLQESLEHIGVGFIDASQDILTDPQWKQNFHLDGAHLAPNAAPLILYRFFENRFNNTNYFVNGNRYKLLQKQMQQQKTNILESFQAVHSHYQTAFIHQFNVHDYATETHIKSLHNSVDGSKDMQNQHADFTWCGNQVTLTEYSYRRTSQITHAHIQMLYKIIFETSLYERITSCIGYDFYIVNCRFVYSETIDYIPTDTQGMHFDGSPRGISRMIWYLNDVTDDDSGPFQYQKADGSLQSVFGNAGTGFIFNAEKLWHRAKPPTKQHRRAIDFILMPRLPKQPKCIIHNGLNNWPCDPYLFSLDNAVTSPSIDTLSKHLFVSPLQYESD